MKVAINVLSQSPGHSTGALSLYVQLARFLPERDPGTEYVYFSGKDDIDYYRSKSDKIGVVGVGWGNRRRPLRVLSEQFLLGPRLAAENVNVVFHSGSGVAPLRFPKKPRLILGIWGMQHVARTDIKAGQRLYRNTLFSHGLRRADVCVVNSKYTRDLLIQHYPWIKAPVAVIRHGVDLNLFNPGLLTNVDLAGLARLHIQQPYVLFVGQLYPYKLLHVLAEAFCRAIGKGGGPHKLVVVGSFASAHGMGGDYKNRVLGIMRGHGLLDRLVLAEDVPIGDLRALYAGAALYVQSSSAETFGRTVIEAMACGCPVLAANSAATPEVLGDAGLYYEADDVETCAEQIQRVLEDSRLHDTLATKGLVRVQEFSFENEVNQMISLFHQTYEGRVLTGGFSI